MKLSKSSINICMPRSAISLKSVKCKSPIQFSSVTQSCPTLRPHELQHARPPCPSPTPGVPPLYENKVQILLSLKKKKVRSTFSCFCGHSVCPLCYVLLRTAQVAGRPCSQPQTSRCHWRAQAQAS